MTAPTSETTAPEARLLIPPGVRVGPLIAVLVTSAFVMILNETIMGVALPALMEEFSAPATSVQWLTTVYLLTMAIVIPTTGYLLQRFALRQMFLASLILFVAGTALAGAAPTLGILIAARVLQAGGTALIAPLMMTTILNVVEPERRGRMMGTISIVIAVAPAIGPTLSGVILDELDWRWMFWLVLPFTLAALVLGSVFVRNVTEPVAGSIDVMSVVLSAVAFGGLIYGLSSIGESAAGHAPVAPWIPLALGAVAIAVFVARQVALKDHALLDLRAFSTRAFAVAVVLVGVSMMALFGSLILLPIYLQSVLGFSTFTTGLILLPGGLTMGLLAPFVGRIFDRVGPRPLVIPGSAIASAGLWLMTAFDTHTTQGAVIAVHVLLSTGLALMLTPLMTSALGSLPQHLYSHGSAIVTTTQQVAGAAGTAIFITVMTRGQAASAQDGLSLVDATGQGIHTAFIWGGVISALAVLIALGVRRPASAAH